MLYDASQLQHVSKPACRHRGWEWKSPRGTKPLRNHGEGFGPSEAMESGTFAASLKAVTTAHQEDGSSLLSGLLLLCLPPPTLSIPHQQPE